MKYKFCPHCGKPTTLKEIGDEGLIPYCEPCGAALWDSFKTAIICAVVNEEGQVALLRQDYVSTTNYVCVAGIIKLGEDAEETVVREVKEELGLDVTDFKYLRSYFYEKGELLMLGYVVNVKKADFSLSCEVDSAEWFELSEAQSKLRAGGVACQLVCQVAKDIIK